jgi:hypothetical protein
VLPDRKDVDPAIGKEQEGRQNPACVFLIPQDLGVVERVTEEQEPKAPRDRGEPDEIGSAEEPTLCTEAARDDDLRFEGAAGEQDRDPRHHEGEAGSVPVLSHATA